MTYSVGLYVGPTASFVGASSLLRYKTWLQSISVSDYIFIFSVSVCQSSCPSCSIVTYSVGLYVGPAASFVGVSSLILISASSSSSFGFNVIYSISFPFQRLLQKSKWLQIWSKLLLSNSKLAKKTLLNL